ncbi:MAG: beta/gamma crystallin-related protein [Hyphomonadaceae bacterium]
MQRAYFRLALALGFGLAGLFSPKAEAQFDRGAQRGGDAAIILYSGTNFRGQARAYYGDVDTLVRDGFNDVARSIQIRSGEWTLCKDRGGQGRCRTINRSIPDLGRLGLDRKLTSFYQSGFSNTGLSGRNNGFSGRNDQRSGFNTQRGFNGSQGSNGFRNTNGQRQLSRGGAPVTLFTKDDFRGRSININGAVNLRDVGFNNKVDSISISHGSWIVCTGRDLGGRCDVLNGSVYDLDDIDLDDNISSIAPYNGRSNTRSNRRRRY